MKLLRQDGDKRKCYSTKFVMVQAAMLHGNNGGLGLQVSENLLLMHTTFQFSIFLVKQG